MLLSWTKEPYLGDLIEISHRRKRSHTESFLATLPITARLRQHQLYMGDRHLVVAPPTIKSENLGGSFTTRYSKDVVHLGSGAGGTRYSPMVVSPSTSLTNTKQKLQLQPCKSRVLKNKGNGKSSCTHAHTHTNSCEHSEVWGNFSFTYLNDILSSQWSLSKRN